ncbi:hypothetical protein BEP19_09550 [Ammoniphilus oxalaticus]|uniref:DUF6385 domain-containing protein n=1 Tax=Ammoniphilus oxalaticus TaxID=66863 RepID=A0A419SKX9_9BACL|nr:hypothetical protein BEP19_09550 [Ammoniphilus oxalaticus]
MIRPLRIKNIQQPVKIKQPITIDKVKQPIKLASPLDIEADRLDIRPLNPVTDGVQVYGSAPTPLLTDSDGRLIITTNLTDPSQNRNYKEITFTDVTAAQEWTYLPAQDTSQLITYTYAVVNQGDSAVQIKLELSPNNVIFQFHRSWEIAPREVGIVVPAYFLHYSRIAVKSADQDRHSAVDIYFQAQQ